MSDTTSAGEGQAKRSRASRPLTDQEVSDLVARNFIAVLATAAAAQPYGVPLIYGFQDNAFYAVLSPGRKISNIQENPHVCVTIVETKDVGKLWKSVVAMGTASFVEDDLERARALDVIRRQSPGVPVRGAGGTAPLQQGYLMLRVGVQEMTGRGNY